MEAALVRSDDVYDLHFVCERSVVDKVAMVQGNEKGSQSALGSVDVTFAMFLVLMHVFDLKSCGSLQTSSSAWTYVSGAEFLPSRPELVRRVVAFLS